MKKIISIFSFVFILVSNCTAQQDDTLFIAFWNLQNLFDTIDDPVKEDEAFLPDGEMEWNDERLNKKMYNLSHVLRMMNKNKGPDLLGVCEVENENVLKLMINKYLNDLDYKIAYIESPDNRGIDNGLIYRETLFELLNVQVDTVHLWDGWPTRLVFGANLLTKNDEQVTVFVNHWPSRRGGREESEPNRIKAANKQREAVDRIFNHDPAAKIFILGDFNDDPVNISLLENLRAHPIKCDSINADFEVEWKSELFNLSYQSYEDGFGSYKYKETWNMLDQIIVSGSLITDDNFYYICDSFEVHKPIYIVTQDGDYKGTPFPTFGGRRHLGGYSDHFPVTAKFVLKGKQK
jgi:predicted extracellular nuclease